MKSRGARRFEFVGIYSLAILVHGLALASFIASGRDALLWFTPAVFGSLLSVWCMHQGTPVLSSSPVSNQKNE